MDAEAEQAELCSGHPAMFDGHTLGFGHTASPPLPPCHAQSLDMYLHTKAKR